MSEILRDGARTAYWAEGPADAPPSFSAMPRS